MKLKKSAIFVAVFLVLLFSFLFLNKQALAPFSNYQIPPTIKISDEPIGAQYTDSSLFLSAIKQGTTQASSQIISGLIVPHHLLAKDMIASAFAYASAGKYQNIVLLSPDHFQAGHSNISVTERNFATVFGELETDKEIAQRLKELPFVSEGNFFYREHGLQAELPFIKYYFPQAKIIALTFQPTVSQTELDQIAEILKNILPANSLIVQSTDFSHYLTPAQAADKDQESLAAIKAETIADILKLQQPENLDSKAALYLQASLQQNFFQVKPQILEHKNSQDYTTEKVSSATSYFTFAYQKEALGKATFIFVGDIMLSRSIGDFLARRQDYNFPFAKIAPVLVGADLVFGNLESPISDQGESSGRLYSFRADPLATPGLKNSGFTVLSVANNHAFDYGLAAFTDTLVNLKKLGLNYAGGGANFTEAHQGAYQEINGIKITVLAYTDLLPKSQMATDKQAGFAYLDEEQMIKDIKQAKEQSDLVIVSFHWGQEYETKANEHQKKIASEAVKAGASLIIGHHPHVVQEYTDIQGVPVAYSLGNFIFDQNFSPETKTGLMLKVEVENKKISGVEPQPINFNNYFQPYF